jgi:hypothetical protein|tara:strand:+ start:26 stop:859 length:834 start_codon:yes stop_codon:yes gene_type:complete
MKDLLRYTIKEQEEFDELFDKRLRRIFTLMKSIPDVDKFMNYFAIPTHNRWSQEISNILKLFGVNVLDTNNRHLSSDSYNGINTFYETFLQNGGSSRNFDEGELDLRPTLVYRILADASVIITEQTQISGEIWGTKSKEEAIEQMIQFPDKWASIDDNIESDYGDIFDVRNLEVYETLEYRITPAMVGLKGSGETNLIEQTEPKTTSKLKFNKQTKKKGAKTDVYNVVKGGTTIGQVKWYSRLRGYGFLPPSGNESEVTEFVKEISKTHRENNKKNK